jgi:drug/metabolite transporter (DMT)-like permease
MTTGGVTAGVAQDEAGGYLFWFCLCSPNQPRQSIDAASLSDNRSMNKDVLYALGAAALFGASTPFAKLLAGDIPPVLLAGLLYLGSGLGLTLARLVRDGGFAPVGLRKSEWPWLLGAICFGGVLGPVALMFGLVSTSGSTASLLLNLEAVLTALIAWGVFKENADRRIVFGMFAIVAGGVALGWQTDASVQSSVVGPALVSLACLCWAIDNNLTRKVAASDALFIAGVKGVIAGTVNTALAIGLGAVLPNFAILSAPMVVGLLGYGISLVLFVLALRGLGTARTGAYFSTAPFIGAAVALLVFSETTSLAFWVAAALMALGVWLHLTEHHSHEHGHDFLEHSHEHIHDEHHQHTHELDGAGSTKHSHPHQHVALRHSHPHYPDTHHRHVH